MSLTPYVPFSLARRNSLRRRSLSRSRSTSGLDLFPRYPAPILDFAPCGTFWDFDRFHDPFDEVDLLAGTDLMWLNRPSLIRTYYVPRQPEKYRVTVDCKGYDPMSIKTETCGKKVIVTAREEQRVDSDNYTMKEFKKSYDLPANALVDKLTSYVVGKDQLIIEVPLQEERVCTQELYLHPVVSEDKKFVSMEFAFPEYLDPSKVSVVCKDNDLIIRAEDRLGTWDKQSHFSYYKRVTMPSNTDFYQLKCKMDKNVLNIHAPLYDSDFKRLQSHCQDHYYAASSSSNRAVKFCEATKM